MVAPRRAMVEGRLTHRSSMGKPVISAVARTPVGRFRGALRSYSAIDLGALAAAEAMRRINLDPANGDIDEVLFGQVLQAGAGQAPARQVALAAGLPHATPCTTINKVCGSGLKTVMIAASAIRADEYNVVLCGGMESMTNAPQFIRSPAKGEPVPFDDLVSTMIHDGLWDPHEGEHMGNTGETVAVDHDVSRDDADAFSARSHQRADVAWSDGTLEWESFPVDGLDREGTSIVLDRDEGIRPGTSVESLSELRTVFAENGSVTAGNASQLSDGAAAIIVASEEIAAANGWPILARIVDQTTSGRPPSKVMEAPIPAVETLLDRNGIGIDDLAVLEHNEAFAAASCAVGKALGVDEKRFNPHGGAVAIGHPLGATGARCLATTINALRFADAREEGGPPIGIATLCLGGGNAVAMLVEAGPDLA